MLDEFTMILCFHFVFQSETDHEERKRREQESQELEVYNKIIERRNQVEKIDISSFYYHVCIKDLETSLNRFDVLILKVLLTLKVVKNAPNASLCIAKS